MKKIAKRLCSSAYVQFVILGIVLLLGTLPVVVAPVTANPAVQQKQRNSYAVKTDPPAKAVPVRAMADILPGPVGFDRVELPTRVRSLLLPSINVQINNNSGFFCSGGFTHSETTCLSFGNTIIGGFNDSGSISFGSHFTGYSRSTDDGVTWTDGGTLPVNSFGDGGDPVLARDDASGTIYFATLGFTNANADVVQVFRSTDNGATWLAPVNGAPGGSIEDKEWIAVDNFPGLGQGNVYVVARNFGAGNGIFLYRSTDDGATFGPNGGTLITPGAQGAFVTVSPDHSVHAWWWDGATIKVRKSTDQGLTFGAPVTVVTIVSLGGGNGDLGLTGVLNGGGSVSIRSNKFPHVAVNTISGNIYVAYNDKITAAAFDKSDIFFVQSTDGGATWSSRAQVNDDRTTTDQWFPNVVVSPAGDRLGIFYYSRQEDTANNNLYRYYGRIGAISGASVSFGPGFAVSETPSFPEVGRDALVNRTYNGDYDQAYTRPGFFDVTWSDDRDDLPGCPPKKEPDVFFESIPLGLFVTVTDPCVNCVVFTQPTDFVVNVSESVNPATLQASDFTCTGTPADTVNYTPGTTMMTFTYNSSPVTTQGSQTMHIPAGAFTRASDGNPVQEFTGTFRYDALLLQVTATFPPIGGTFAPPGPGSYTYDVNFNEALDPASVQTSDLILSGLPATVTAATVINGNTTAEFTINITDILGGTLTAEILSGAITDSFGNPCAAFSGNYQYNASPFCDIGIILNDGFETGTFPPWLIDGHLNDPVISTAQVHSGTFSALAGNVDPQPEPLGDSSFYQQFTVPAGGATLSFWHWDFSNDGIAFDWQDAYITNASGHPLQTIFHQCNNDQTWLNTQVNMAPYAGQTVRIKFLVHQDGFGDDTAMYVDDVALFQPCASPTATPRVTPRPRPTPHPRPSP